MSLVLASAGRSSHQRVEGMLHCHLSCHWVCGFVGSDIAPSWRRECLLGGFGVYHSHRRRHGRYGLNSSF